jgi:type IV secretory pathway VirB4 component
MPPTIAQNEKKAKVPAVCELLPVRDILDNVVVRTNGAFVAGYELRGVQSYFATDDDRNLSKDLVQALLRSLPDVSMRLQLRYEITDGLGDLLPGYLGMERVSQSELMALDVHRLEMWQQRERQGYYLSNRLHVYYHWDPRIHANLYHSAERKRKSGGLSLSRTKCIERLKKEHITLLSECESIMRGVEASMEAARIGPRRLTDDELFDEINRAQVPHRQGQRPLRRPEDLLEYRSMREQVTEASILSETESYLNIDGYLYSVISIKELPDATLPGMLQRFATLGFPLVINAQVMIPDQVKVLKGYKKRLQKMVAAQKDGDGNAKDNPEAAEAASQLRQVQREIVSSSLKTAKMSISVVVRTSNRAVTFHELEEAERELANRSQEVLNSFQRMNGAKAIVETLAKRRLFIGALPAMGETDFREQDMLTPNAADLLPIDMPWTGTRRSPLILFETPFRQLIPYSPFDPDLANANGLIFGTTGSGKSVLAQQFLLMGTRANALVTILERGNSYLPLVELMGGQMIEMSLDSTQTINPWDLPKGDSVPSKDQLAFLKNVVRHMLGEHTPPDMDIDLLDAVLLQAISETYKRCSSRRAAPIPLFSDLAAELAHWQDKDRNQKINEMAHLSATKLRAWVDEGPYAQLFDRPTTIELNNPWLYFNVEGLKNDPRLDSAMSLLIAHAATHRGAGHGGRRSITMLDECWALLQSPNLADAVVQLFRTARKRDAGVWGISQTPEDFVGTDADPIPHGAGILKNATTKIIGKQPGDMSALRKHVHLNDTALNQIKTFSDPKKGHSSEFLIAIGEKAEMTHAIRIVPSPVDLWITTTYPRERKYRTWFMRHNSHLPAFSAYEELARRFPHGLASLGELPEERSGAVMEALAS